jgi:hypothetical protein
MPTTQPRQPKLTNEEETQNIAYWMGRVDANITEIKTAIDAFSKKDDTRWSEFEGWRRNVDERLQRGTSRFEDHARRLGELEELVSEKPKEHPPEEEKEEDKFGTWGWFRDSYLEKLVLIVVTVLIYKIIEIVVQHWTVVP